MIENSPQGLIINFGVEETHVGRHVFLGMVRKWNFGIDNLVHTLLHVVVNSLQG